MPTQSKLQTTIDAPQRRLPKNRPPTHPGEMLLEEFLADASALLKRLLPSAYKCPSLG
jgi:hypothetical protein